MKRAFAILCGGLLLHGCVTLVRGPVIHSSERVVRSRNDTIANSEITATITPTNSDGESISAQYGCTEFRNNTIRRTTEYEVHNTNVAASPVGWTLLGLTFVGVGVAGLVSPSSFAARPGDTGTGLGGGIFFSAVGVAALTTALVNAILVNQSDRVDQDITAAPEIIRPRAPCLVSQPVDNAEVSIRANGRSHRIGALGSGGTLAFHIHDIVPRELVVGANALATAEVEIAGRTVGQIDLTSATAVWEAQAWALLDAERCATGGTASACALVANYVRDFPHGAHISTAQTAIALAEQHADAERARVEAQREAEMEVERQRVEQAREAERLISEQRQAEEQRREQAQAAIELREQQARAAAALRLTQCRAACASTCSGDANCSAECVHSHCH